MGGNGGKIKWNGAAVMNERVARSELTARMFCAFTPQVRGLPNYDECMVPAALANDAMMPLTPASVVRTTLPRDQRPARALPCGVAEYEFLCKSRVRRNRKRPRLGEAGIYALPLDRLLTRHNDTPVFYMRTDPQLTWFHPVVTYQAPLNAINQLMLDKDLSGQCEAVLACAQTWRIQLCASSASTAHSAGMTGVAPPLPPLPPPPLTPASITARRKNMTAQADFMSTPPVREADDPVECTPLDMYSRALVSAMHNTEHFFLVRALAGRCIVQSLSWASAVAASSTHQKTDRYASEASCHTLHAIRFLCTSRRRRRLRVDSDNPPDEEDDGDFISNDFSSVSSYRLKLAFLVGLGDICCARFCATPIIDTTLAFQSELHATRNGVQQEALIRFLQDLLANNQNGENSYDDTMYVAIIVESLGRLSTGGLIRDVQLRHSLWQDLLQQVHRDQLFPTRHGLIGARALVALARFERSQLQQPSAATATDTEGEDDVDAYQPASLADAITQVDYTKFIVPTSSHEMCMGAFAALVHVAPVRGLHIVLPNIQTLLQQQLDQHHWHTAYEMTHHLAQQILTEQCPRAAFQYPHLDRKLLVSWNDLVWHGAVNATHVLPDRMQCAFYHLYLVTWGRHGAPRKKRKKNASVTSSPPFPSHTAERRRRAQQDLTERRAQRSC
jgi:hypothetical protein